MFSFFTIPTTTDMLASIGDVSVPFASYLLPIAFVGAGFLIGGMIIYFMLKVIERAFNRFFGDPYDSSHEFGGSHTWRGTDVPDWFKKTKYYKDN